MANPWFRLYAEFATDAKVQSIPEVMQRRLIMLFCLRCSDVLVTLSDDEIAFQLRIGDADLAETKVLFMRKGFINKEWEIANWDKRQYASDSSTARTAAYRERKRNAARTSPKQPSDALDTEAETEADTEKNKKTEAPSERAAVKPKKARQEIASSLPSWMPQPTWDDFLAMRKAIKKPITVQGLPLAINKLSSLRDAGNDPKAVLEQSILGNWQGLFELRTVGRQEPAVSTSGLGVHGQATAAAAARWLARTGENQ